MAIFAKREQKDFVLHPEGGPFTAVVSKVALHEGVETQYGLKDRLQITFQTDTKMRDHVAGVEDDRPLSVAQFVNNTLNNGSRLLELVQQQVPKERLEQLLQESGDGLDVERLLVGSQWLIMVEHAEVNGKTYDNITSAMRAPANQHLDIWEEDQSLPH